jgi:transposase
MDIHDKIKINGGDTLKIEFLGIIATFFKLYSLIDFVDQLLPKAKEYNVTHGESFLFLTLYEFSSKRRTLYTMSDELHKTPIFLLFGRDIDIKDFSDNVLGAFFDAINDYGPSLFFSRIVHHLSRYLPDFLCLDRLHANITNFTIYGEYTNDDNYNMIKIVHNHLKDERNHLKRLSLVLITNSLGSPVFMKGLSGNCSDNKELNLSIHELIKSMQNIITNDHKPIFIAYESFYSDNNIKDFSFYFLTRVPETIKDCKELKYKDIDLITFDNDPRYSYYLTTSSYAGVEQQWLLVHSTEMELKQRGAFERRLENEMAAGTSALETLERKAFACEADARREAEIWISKYNHLKFDALDVTEIEINHNKKREQPKVEQKFDKSYYINGKLSFDTLIIEKKIHTLGRFVLATNNMDLIPANILKYYNEKSKVENCFRFIKGNELMISEIILKNVEKNQGLYCFIALTMLISSLLELLLRSGLKQNGTTILNTTNKQTDNQTLLHAFKKFNDFNGILIYEKEIDSINLVLPIYGNTQLLTILKAFGDDYVNFYNYNSGYVPFHKAGFIIKNLC